MFMISFSKLRFLLIPLLILILTSCDSSQPKSGKDLSIIYDDLNIAHNELILSNYFFKSKVSGEDSLWVFDIKTNTLALFDIEKKQPLRSIEFSVDGPNFIGNQITDISITSTSLLTLDLQYLSIFDFNGEIRKRIELNDIKGYSSLFRLDKMVSLNNREVILSIAHLTGRIPGTLFPESTPLFMKLNLETEAISFLEPSYPTSALLDDPTQGYWGITAPTTLTYNDSRLLYSFRFSSKIYELNLLNNKVSIHNANTSLTENTKPPLAAELYKNTRELAKFGLGGLNFKSILYDSKNERYFRLHTLVEYGDKGLEPSRNAFLTILNSAFEVIHESKLSDELIPYALINDGKLIIKKKTETEGRYDLSLLSID